MTLTDKDIGKIAALLRPIEQQIDSLSKELREFKDETRTNFDDIFKRDEAREQENLALRSQVEELEKKVA